MTADIDSGAKGNGGNLTETRQLNVRDGAQVSASTYGEGNGGNLTIHASDSVQVIGTSPDGKALSRLEADVASGAKGNSGNLTIETRNLSVRGGAQVSASTLGAGNAGNLRVHASDSVELSGEGEFPGGLFAQVDMTGMGHGGNLTIETGRLSVSDGSKVQVSTFGQGDAGNLLIRAPEVEVIGTPTSFYSTGIFAEVSRDATGQGGDLRIQTGQLFVRDGGQVAVNSQGSGNAGNLDVTARSIQLDNQGNLTAETLFGNGGNISLQVGDLLLLRHGSLISTTAGTAQSGGNGGNITINSPLIVAVPKEDSDIRANAYTGSGGNVQITTQGIFGLQFRPQDTPLSDITASSQFGVNGTVQISTPGVDPSRGLTDLSTAPVDASRQIAQNCPARGSRGEVASSLQEMVACQFVLEIPSFHLIPLALCVLFPPAALPVMLQVA